MEILIPIIIVLAIGLIAGLGLSIASVVMAVPVDERVEKVREQLPGANCGACGYSGCDGYAEAVSKGECATNLCAPGGQAATEAISAIMGVTATAIDKQIAVVNCNGNCENVQNKMDYKGINSCAAANMLYGGTKECKYGCLGFGDCVKACLYDAVHIIDGKAVIDPEKCVACGACIKACPKGIISLKPYSQCIWVYCSNKDKGAMANKVCKVSCIACGKCAKTCEFDAISVQNNLAVINPENCTNCGKCAESCPKKSIL